MQCMKPVLWMMLGLFLATALPAQISLTGIVIDKTTGEKLESAIVSIPELKRGAITNNQGNFSFDKLPKGNYLLNIKYVGYASLNAQLKLSGDTTLLVTLSPTAAELNDVVVTGISTATEVKESPIAITL